MIDRWPMCGAYRGRNDRWAHVCDGCLYHYRVLEGLSPNWRGLCVTDRGHFVYTRAAWREMEAPPPRRLPMRPARDWPLPGLYNANELMKLRYPK